MPDSATSTHPGVQRQLDRLTALSPGADILGLDRITTLLARIGNPHERIPPAIHVAGTNGKGSTCAFLRAAIEAAGHRVHVYSSPHLVRFNERIRLAGRLIEDEPLAHLLEEVLDSADGIGASFFEVTTAAAFLAFSRTPAAATIVEVGLGGRLDATNVIRPTIAAIAQLGIDHQAFLGDTAEAIAAEKAGIAKPNSLLVTMRYPPAIAAVVEAAARAVGTAVLPEGKAWRWSVSGNELRYADGGGTLVTPLPALAGPHQPANYALALATLRFHPSLGLPPEAMIAAATQACWPARMQRLGPGPLTRAMLPGGEIWLDGGHNAAAAEAVSAAARQIAGNRPLHLIVGMLANKDAKALIASFPNATSLAGVPVPGHEHHTPEHLAAVARKAGIPATGTAPDVQTALKAIPVGAKPPIVLILGSLYLAGTVLEANGELPA